MKNLISAYFSNFDSASISAAASALQFSLDSSMARESGLISLRDEHVYSERGEKETAVEKVNCRQFLKRNDCRAFAYEKGGSGGSLSPPLFSPPFRRKQGREREEKETSSQFASFRFLPLLLLLWPLLFSFSFRVSSGSASFLPPSSRGRKETTVPRVIQSRKSLSEGTKAEIPFDIPFPRNLVISY